MEKFKEADFGRCQRVLCENQALLPVGCTNDPFQQAVKLYCPRCEDIYYPRAARHQIIDGAYFGTTFPHLFLLAFPQAVPQQLGERYQPKIFGFRIHAFTRRLKSPPADLVEKTKAFRLQQQQKERQERMDLSGHSENSTTSESDV